MRRFHYNRISSAISVGNSDNGIGKIDSVPTGNHFLPYGTVISNGCWSSNPNDRGEINISYDALGTEWNGFYYNWKELANGTGGSFWQQTSPALAGTNGCYYPYGFVTSGYVNSTPINWEYNGQSGTYNWGEQWDVYFSDGNGGTLHDSGTYEYHGTGFELSQTGYWADGKVVYVSIGGWTWWYNYGYSLGAGWETITSDVGCGAFGVHNVQYEELADGAGGSFRSYTGFQDNPSYGTLLTNCNDYNYEADGNGWYYQASFTGGSGCPSYGTEVSSDSGYYTVNFGCGDINVGNWGSTTYADGNCGTFSYGGASYYYYNGQLIQNCNDYNYYSDGGNGSYQGEYTGGGGSSCPSYGSQVNSGSGDYTVTLPDNNNYYVGSYGWTEYADGNCGTYTSGVGYYTGYGTYITTLYDVYVEGYGQAVAAEFYSDGNGGYYYNILA